MSQPEMVLDSYGSKHWFLNRERHREDGPAVEWPNGTKFWYLNNKWHREDGPAVERSNGTKQWFLNNKEVTWKEVFRNANGDLEKECRILVAALTTS
jgi:hypothetical protein